MGFGFAFFCGLNRLALFLGLFINNPRTRIPSYAAGTYLGGLIIGFPQMPPLAGFELGPFLSSDFWGQLARHWHILKPMVVGSSVLSVLLSAFSYVAALTLIRQRRAHQVRP